MSLLAVGLTFALLSMFALVVDGSIKIGAARDADVAAAAAARAGIDAAAGPRLVGESGASQAFAAANQTLHNSGVPGSVQIRGNTLSVSATVNGRGLFLPLTFSQTATVTADLRTASEAGGS